MSASRQRHVLPAVAVAVLLSLVAAAYVLRMPAAPAGIGGPFDLVSSDGPRLSSRDLAGRPFAIFFGFTGCPDICPTTLLGLSNVIRELGDAADRMRFLFVSIDPERDTPELMKLYLSSFDRHITGLTGTPEEIAAVAKAYRAYYAKVPTSDGYTMNHTAVIYLMSADASFSGTLNVSEPPEQQADRLRRLIATQG